MNPLKSLILTLAISALLGGYLIYVVNPNLEIALLLFLLSSFVSLLYVRLISFHINSAVEAERKKNFIESLSEIVYLKDKKRPLISAVYETSSISDSYFSRLLKELANRIKYGIEISEAFDATTSKILNKKFDWLGTRITSSANSIRSFLDLYERESVKKIALIGPRIQATATISMFISTILPAFIIFAFIGSTIVSNEIASFFILSVLMLVVVPVIYALISVFQNDCVFNDL